MVVSDDTIDVPSEASPLFSAKSVESSGVIVVSVSFFRSTFIPEIQVTVFIVSFTGLSENIHKTYLNLYTFSLWLAQFKQIIIKEFYFRQSSGLLNIDHKRQNKPKC